MPVVLLAKTKRIELKWALENEETKSGLGKVGFT